MDKKEFIIKSVSVRNNPENVLRNQAQVLAKKMKEVFIDFAEIMYNVKKDELWKKWGYYTFRDYVDQELKLSRTSRTIGYFINIYEHLCIGLNKTKDDVRSIPWTNVRELPKLIKRDIITKDNVDDWLDKARNTKQKDFVIDVKKEICAHNLEEDSVDYVHKTFVLHKEQFDNISIAIQCAMQINELEWENMALDNICLEFNARHAAHFMKESKRQVLVALLKDIEYSFDVNLLAISNNKEVMFGDFLMLCNLYDMDTKTFKFLKMKKNIYKTLLNFYNKSVEKYGNMKFILNYEDNNLSLLFDENVIDLNYLLEE